MYNGERFLAQALDSLLAQTVTDLELIISDNASTDGTPALCREYVRRDPRVRYVRQPVNIGAPRNWNAVVHEARGTFFKWASANDTCAPTMLERCVARMQTDPGIVLCQGLTQLVDEDERPIQVYGGDASFDDERPSDRYARVAKQMEMNNAQSGVIRLDVLRRTGLDRLYPSGDMALMAELALYGKFVVLPEVLLTRRQGAATFSAMKTPLEAHRLFKPDAKAPMRLLVVRRHLDALASIARARIPVREKLRACRIALTLARWDRVRMWRELLAWWRDRGGAG